MALRAGARTAALRAGRAATSANDARADAAAAGPAVGDSRGHGRIGVVVPVSNSNLEADMTMLRPPGVSMHFMRVGGYDLDAVPDGTQMRKLALASLEPVVDALTACRVEVILYGCTSATLAHGPAFDRALRQQIEARAGVPAITAASAVVEALRDLGATRIGYASPYVRSLNQEAAAYFGQCGFEIVSTAQVETDLGNYGQGELTPQEVFELGLRADHAQAEAVVLSCTDMRAVEAIAALEDALGKAVVTSNQSLLHAAVKRLRRRVAPPAGFGRLLSSAPATNLSAPAPKDAAAPTPRASILDLAPYPTAAASVGTATAGQQIYLNQNECAAQPSPRVLAAYRAAANEVNRYADGTCAALRQKLAEVHGLDPERIVCGNGSGELIALLACAYAGVGDEILTSRYAYLYFDTAARIAGAVPVRAGGSDLAFDSVAVLGAVTARTRMLCVDNPNNPTGAMLGGDELRALRAQLRDDVLLVLDAAYAEYATGADYAPGDALVEVGDNTVMLRTFSKIHGLAGARVGWAYCPAPIAAVLNRMRLPNNVSGPSQAAALAALEEGERVASLRARNATLRRRFERAMNALGLRAHPSEGSYVLVRFADAADAEATHAALARRGIHGRPMHAYGLADAIRFTIGAESEIDALIAAVTELRAGAAARRSA
ncbi:MAG: aminotransferase class I/II-fold pyridoxal phosphate-dependent enzyme [bacterium]